MVGRRRSAWPYGKPRGTYRIVLVGDSFVDGYTEELGDRVGYVLERRLNEGAPAGPVEVISLGAGGYSTDRELLWLEREGLRYEPDLVVLLFYANDIWYNGRDRYWRGSKPMFEVSGDSLILTGVPAIGSAAGPGLSARAAASGGSGRRPDHVLEEALDVQRIPVQGEQAVRAEFEDVVERRQCGAAFEAAVGAECEPLRGRPARPCVFTDPDAPIPPELPLPA